jgi:16S rRNA (adenine1518-N6/adenine1519-N6)-dimethyltransferase
MQKLGQHFLKNKKVAEGIAAAVAPSAGDEVIEIGPGHGELTALLADACEDAGATLTLIERDARLIEGLRTRFEAAEEKNAGRNTAAKISIMEGDALTILPRLLEQRREAARLILTGNLPYYITGHLFRIIGEAASPPERSVFMIQREVAERIIAAPPHMNRLAASVQFWAEPQIILAVPRSDFSPPPKVESAVITLTKKPHIYRGGKEGKPSREGYYRALRALFAQPRKTIMNNIAAALPEKEKMPLMEAIEDIHVIPGARPQDLSIEEIGTIAKKFFS